MVGWSHWVNEQMVWGHWVWPDQGPLEGRVAGEGREAECGDTGPGSTGLGDPAAKWGWVGTLTSLRRTPCRDVYQPCLVRLGVSCGSGGQTGPGWAPRG